MSQGKWSCLIGRPADLTRDEELMMKTVSLSDTLCDWLKIVVTNGTCAILEFDEISLILQVKLRVLALDSRVYDLLILTFVKFHL